MNKLNMTAHELQALLIRNDMVLVSLGYIRAYKGPEFKKPHILFFDKVTVKFFVADINISRDGLEILITNIRLGMHQEEDI